MNKTFISIWSAVHQTWVAAAETSRARGKRTSSKVAAGTVVLLAAGGLGGTAAEAALVGTPVQAQNGTYSSGNASATGADSVAVGASSIASGQGATAVGAASTASGTNATALGVNSTASGTGSNALGWRATSTGNYATAVGTYADSAGDFSTAVGPYAKSSGISSTAVGVSASSAGSNSAALGTFASSVGDSSVALGRRATSAQENSVALGHLASASVANSVALGAGATTTANLDAAAYNPGTAALSGMASTANGEVSVGSSGTERRVTNVAAGSAATDAVNVSQLQSAAAVVSSLSTSTSTGISSLSTGVSSLSTGLSTTSSRLDSLSTSASTGIGSLSTGLSSLSTGLSTTSSKVDSLSTSASTGIGSLSTGLSSLSTGLSTTSSKVDSLSTSASTGIGSLSTGLSSLSTGLSTTSSKVDSLSTSASTGIGSLSTGISSLSTGLSTTVSSITSLSTGVANAVQYDTAARDGVTLGGKGAIDPVGLHNVAEGALTSTSTDAVNGSQLFAATTSIGKLDDRVTNVEGSVTSLTQQFNSGGVGLVKQDAATNNITVASDKHGSSLNIAGLDGLRTLNGVAAGSADTDAVNVGQLKQSGIIDANGNAQDVVNYDAGSNKGTLTLAGVNGTQLKNVADGTEDTDAVNVRQLRKSGLVDATGNSLDAVTYDVDSNRSSVTFGNAGTPVMLHNVAAGTASTDAANVGQLRSVAGALGAGIDAGGQFVAPSYTLNDVTYNNVADALQGLAGSVGNTSNRVTVIENTQSVTQADVHMATSGDPAKVAVVSGDSAVAIGAGATASSNGSVALGAGSTTGDRENTVSVGSAQQKRQIANVADGTAPSDAVNVGQLSSQVAQGVQQANNYTDQRVNDMYSSINTVAKNAYAGIAAAMAMPNMTPSGPGRTIVAAGGATYKGGSAGAVGATYRSRNGSWLVNGAVAVTSTGDAGVRAHVGYEF